MKPPPRTRGRRPASSSHEAAPQEPQRPSERWSYMEQRKLLNGLRRISKTAETQEKMRYDLLRKYVPTRSASEIQSLVDSLKTKVFSWASLTLKRKRREEEKSRKPIEEWTHMSSVVAGSLEKSISASFRQMLKVSSTEPCTLRNCDPPQVHRPTTEDPPSGFTIPLRPFPRMPVQGAVKQRRPRSPQNTPPGAAAASKQHAPVPGPSTTCSAAPPTTSEQHPTTSMSTSIPSVASSSSPIQPTPPVSIPKPAPHMKTGKMSKHSSTQRMMGVKYVVDFEKIYNFLAEIQTPNEACCLTPMESAIMLDLLMSLPEELSLLDCNSLKKHLLQVYKGLQAPADSNQGREVLRGRISADRSAEAESQSGQSCASSSQSEEGAALEGCPPLNPFMVPVELLKRK